MDGAPDLSSKGFKVCTARLGHSWTIAETKLGSKSLQPQVSNERCMAWHLKLFGGRTRGVENQVVIMGAVCQVEKLLGSGSYGRVYRVQRVADGKTYALKQMSVHKMSASERQAAMNEVWVSCDCCDFHVRLDLPWLSGCTQSWPFCRYGCSPLSAVPMW